LLELGWEIDVVCAHPDSVRATRDDFLSGTVPAAVRIHRVRGLPVALARLPGLGTLGHRCAGATLRRIAALLRDGSRFDAAYFSTTQFPVHRIIPRLKKLQPSLRVVMDYQDPWVNDYYTRHPEVRPPGGRLKHAIATRLDAHMERATLPQVNAFTTVSPAYPEELRARHPAALAGKPWLVLPFPAAEQDFEAVRAAGIVQTRFNPADGRRHWVYVGRGGPDMARALRGFFRALRHAIEREPALTDVRIHFLGTDYAAPGSGRPSILPVAAEEGVADYVTELPERIPYSEALRCLLDAQALLVPGSDDPAYTASKIYPCILAQKPLLAIFHQASSVVDVIRCTRAGTCATFDSTTTTDQLAATVNTLWFQPRAHAITPATDWVAFAPYSARAMTDRLSDFLRATTAP